MIHYANIKNSKRLQRVLNLLADGCEHTTRDIIQRADVCAVNTAIAELRSNGYEIKTKDLGLRDGAHIYSYQWPSKRQQLDVFAVAG